ncbi:hypothetical protein [Acidiplasma cupricumulans]|uniref:hypothetical protein n=1 Tax=Acidiplasma cupricumulans TaxID=312540 RepID=UPI000781E624|nr:hypothetical protein [Acidiplasma cupricumulans]
MRVLKKILQNNVLLLKITLEQGPCTDNMCQLIKKPSYEINSDFKYKDSFKIDKDIKIEIPKDIYNSISHERDRVVIKDGISGKIVIRGLSLVGTA